MNVRITNPPPIPAEHGAVAGRVFATVPNPQPARIYPASQVWVMGDKGTAVRLLPQEFVIVPEGEAR